ncbi:MAG: hypothetical protein KKE93_01810 [Nanoarchaeota archaeon]|nr:hypothetical protein [Nanoarchaeota archaeon]
MVNTKNPGASQPSQTVKPKPSFLKGPGLPSVIIVIIAGLAALNFTGVINLSGFLNPASDNYLNWEGVFNPDNSNADFRDSKTISPEKCPKTSAEMGKPCCTVSGDGEIRPTVNAVYVYASCECPSDTAFLQMAPEGDYKLYKICECRCGQ